MHLYIICLSILINIYYIKKVNMTIISKCYYDGDFQVNCNTRAKIINNHEQQSDQIEVMRYARVINGLHYNDTLCSYVPGASCYRSLDLLNCIDKPICNVKNNWFSLEPDCNGNSYYTQFEYDCQPAYYMCSNQDLIQNAFSGLIFSPSYPLTFRSDRTDPCYLTIKLPKNHHAEITLEQFDLMGSSKCIGDYLEIQQYVESSLKNKRSQSTGDKILNKTLNRSQRRPNYKWHTLGTMCGQIENAYTIRATSNTINFKFRPLPANHQSLISNLNNKRNHLGFKIYFQAIPPKDHLSEEDFNSNKKTSTKKLKTTNAFNDLFIKTTFSPTDLDSDQAITDNTNYNQNKQEQPLINISSWITTLVTISVILLILIFLVLTIIIYLRKKRQLNNSNNRLSNKNSNNKNSINQINKNVSKKSNLNDLEDLTPLNSHKNNNLSLKTEAPKDLNQFSQSNQGQNSSKTKIVLEPEPRKMQAERPVLLQDLSQSRLLLKFQQEMSSNNAKNDSNSNNNNIINDVKIDQQKDTINITKEQKSPDKNIKQNSKKLVAKQSAPTFYESVYTGEDNLSSGVYGADLISLNTKPTSVVNSTNVDKQIVEDNNNVNDKKNTDDEDIEKAYLKKASEEINEKIVAKEPVIKSIIKNVDNINNNSNETNTQTTSNVHFSVNTPTMRKAAFNPLHVILKDKNKYHTTEYI